MRGATTAATIVRQSRVNSGRSRPVNRKPSLRRQPLDRRRRPRRMPKAMSAAKAVAAGAAAVDVVAIAVIARRPRVLQRKQRPMNNAMLFQ